jgi:alpha-beta hydrolase superfamily lysophospholipase
MEGYAFYALDLRKHGRSLRPHQHPNFCKNIAEYYPEITRSIDVIGAPVLLAGHSTGGLVARSTRTKAAPRSGARPVARTARSSTGTCPTGAARSCTWRRRSGASFRSSTTRRRCCRTTRRRCSTRLGIRHPLKPVPGFPVYYGWLGASPTRKRRCTPASIVRCPVLAMHSDEADIVLDWRHIGALVALARPRRQRAVLPRRDARCDVVAARDPRRGFRQLFSWAERAVMSPA